MYYYMNPKDNTYAPHTNKALHIDLHFYNCADGLPIWAGSCRRDSAIQHS